MKKFRQMKVTQMWDGYWAVIWETKGEQPKVIKRFKEEKDARRYYRDIRPKKKPKRRIIHEAQ